MDTAYVIVPVADVYKNHTFTSEVVTQALMYEKVTIFDTHDNWSMIEQWDGYQGWINNFYIINTDQSINYINFDSKIEFLHLFSKCNFLISMKPPKGSPIPYGTNAPDRHFLIDEVRKFSVPYGVRIPIIYRRKYVKSDYEFRRDFKGDIPGYAEFPIPHETEGLTRFVNSATGWVEYNCLKDAFFPDSEEKTRENIHLDMISLIGTPYKWGGKSGFGFDCSGLVQTVFKANGITMPRDSTDQFSIIKNDKIELEKSKVGDLIFFKENGKICHVGIYDDNFHFIHCSGMVKHNSLNEEDDLFDKKLMDKFAGVFSMSKIIKDQLNERK